MLIEATTEPVVVAEVDRMLGLADEVIRHKVIRLPDKVAGRALRPSGNASAPVVETTANGA